MIFLACRGKSLNSFAANKYSPFSPNSVFISGNFTDIPSFLVFFPFVFLIQTMLYLHLSYCHFFQKGKKTLKNPKNTKKHTERETMINRQIQKMQMVVEVPVVQIKEVMFKGDKYVNFYFLNWYI